MTPELLRQANSIMPGRPMPGGVVELPFPKGFLMPMVIPATGNPVVTTFTKEITGDAPWELRAISCDQGSFYAAGSWVTNIGIRLQIQLPDGRYLFGGNGIDLEQFGWVGSWRWLQEPGLRFEPGEKINVTLSSSALVAPTEDFVAVNLLFEGATLYYLQGDGTQGAAGSSVAALPRYQGSLNENIMAPCWMSNEGLRTPPGFAEEYFIYSSPDPIVAQLFVGGVPDPLTTFAVAAGEVTSGPQQIEIPIDPGPDFYVRRMLFDVGFQYPSALAPVAGSVLGRLRTGAGYALNNSKVDLAQYLCGAEFAGQWKVRGGDSVYVDVELADAQGTGNVIFQVHLEGYRRRAV